MADRHGHDAGLLADLLGVGHLIAVLAGPRTLHRRAGRHAARRAVDHVDALGLQQAREPHALLEAPAGVVLAGEAHEQRFVLRPDGAHALRHLDGKAHAVRLRAAVGVGALVGGGREELVDQVAVGGVDLDHVEAGLVGARCRLAPLDREVAHLVVRQRPRRRRALGVRHGAGRHQLPAFPVEDLGLSRPRAACRPPRAASAAPCARNGRAGCRRPRRAS